MSIDINLNAILTACGTGILTMLVGFVKMSISKTLRRIERISAQLVDIRVGIASLESKISHIEIAKDEMKEDLKDLMSAKTETIVKLSGLKKDVDAAHMNIRKFKNGEGTCP